MNAREQAVRTAGERLERIETWAKRTYQMACVRALALVVVATIAVNFAIDYARAKGAMAEASRKLSEDAKARFPGVIKGGLR